MIFPRHTSISVRVILALVLVTSLLMLMVGLFAARELRRILLADLHSEQASRAEQIAVALTLPAWNFDREQIERVLEGALLQNAVVQAEVRLNDRNATRLARARPPADNPAAGMILTESRPIKLGAENLGTVVLQATTAPMEAQLERFQAWMIAFGLTVDGLLVGSLYLLMWRSVLRPLRRIERFASAPEAVPLEAGSVFQGELETLRNSLVAMIGRLRTNEAQLRVIGDNLPDSMVYQVVRESDGRMHFTYVSAGVERIHGVKAEDVLRDPTLLYRQIAEEDLAAITAAEAASETTMSVFSATIRMRRADGTIRWVQLCSQPRRLSDGRLAWDGIEMDITERKQVEQERERLAQVVEAHDEAAYWMDVNNRFVYANDAGCRVLGYTRDELIGAHVTLIAPRATEAMLDFLWKQLRVEGSFRREGRHRRKDGSDFPVEISGTYVRIDGRELNCGFARDITTRKATEHDLRRQVDELRRWQQVTLSREDRIAQLKAEVNELCDRLAAPPRYARPASLEMSAPPGKTPAP